MIGTTNAVGGGVIDEINNDVTTLKTTVASNTSDIADITNDVTDLQDSKQDKLTAGDNISISGSKISATDTKYTAGTNVSISSSNVISATDTKYSAGTGLSLSGTTINHSNSVTAKISYVGSFTRIPRIKYDSQGHITGSQEATVYPPTTEGTSGQLWTSQGSGVGKWVSRITINSVANFDTDSFSYNTWYGGYSVHKFVTIKCRWSQNLLIRCSVNGNTSNYYHIWSHWDNNHGDGMASASFILPAGDYFYVERETNRDKDQTDRKTVCNLYLE